MTAGDEKQKLGSGDDSDVPCEALGLVPDLGEAQQFPVTSPCGGPQLSSWAQDPVLIQSSCGQPFVPRTILSKAAPERVGTLY